MGKYFTIAELTRSATAQSRGIDNTPVPAALDALEGLIANILDPVRERWGAPIRVNSGYRSPMLNKAVNGAVNSQHARGEAADITAGDPVANRRLFEIIISSGLEFDQLIDERNYSWLHISYAKGRNRNQVLHL